MIDSLANRLFRSHARRVRRFEDRTKKRAHRHRTACFEALEAREYLAADLIITEFMANNDSTLADSDGNFSDWIEVHNPDDAPVNLSGWSLTDNANNLSKWQFPYVNIEPGGYQVVFASGKDRSDDSYRLTTDFHATPDGTFLVDLPEGSYEIRLTLGDATRVRDQVAIHLQGELVDTVSTDAGEFAAKTYSASLDGTTSSQLAIRLVDQGGVTSRAAIGAIVITSAAGAEVGRFDFGNDGSALEPGFTRVTSSSVYSAGAGFGWQGSADFVLSTPDRGLTFTELHTNFKLRSRGEYVALVSPGGVVVSEFGPAGSDYPFQLNDVSYGLPVDGSEPGFLASPTPDAANGMKRSVPVEFDRPSGVFRDSFSLTLSVDTPGATIHFTLDGSEPTEQSPVYTGPITISTTTHVQAISLAAGLATSTPSNRWFLTVDTDLENFSSDLPILVFDSFSQGFPSEQAYQLNAMALFEPSEETGRSSLLNEPTVITRSGLRKRGSLSARQEKANYALETWDDQNDDQAVSLLGMPSDSDWVLYAPYDYDRPMLRNPLIFELSNQMGRYAPRTRYVEVYLNTNGGDVSAQDYYGVYVLMEKIKSGPDRVDIQELEPYHENEPEISGGWILKIDPLDPGDQGFNVVGESRKIAYVDPKEAEVTPAQASWIKNHINEMYAVIRDTDPETGYAKYIDVDSWIDYHILNTFPMNTDALRRSVYFFKDRGGKIEMGPLWDFNRSMEAADLPRDDNPEAWQNPGVLTDYFGHNWWGELFEDPNFKQKWIDRWFELRRDILSTAHVESMVDSLASEVAEAQVRNFERWPEKLPRTADESSYKFGPLDGTWEGEVAQMKAWLFHRLLWIDKQFATPPVITPGAGRVPRGQEITLSGVTGPIYYTSDGSDPRLPGGAINPSAIMIDEEVSLVFSAPVTIVARAMPGDEWSAPVTAQFLMAGVPDDATDLAVTEINYHPYAPTESELALGWGRKDFEFIELVNAGGHTIDLANVAFVDGFEFTFGGGEMSLLAPGSHVVVVANQDAFAARYGTGLAVAGEFASGGLNKNGERIVLVDRYGVVIQDFEYGDTVRWPGRADGRGSTLEVINTAGDYGNAKNWRGSSAYGGSPGEGGSGPLSNVVLNEVLSRSGPGNHDLVELANTTDLPIDVSGWYLSDDGDDLLKWALPVGTTIPAGGHLVLDERDFGFALNGRSGDEVWLVEADRNTGKPLRFADHVAFAAAKAGGSLGRWPDGDPAGALFPMTRQTFGSANSGPAVGSLVISEVHYQPVRYGETFEAGTADGFTSVLGQWAVAGGRYEVVPVGNADTIATFAAFDTPPDEIRVATTVNFPATSSFNRNAAVIFDYRGETDFKFASVHSNGRVRIGQRDENGWDVLNEFKWVVPEEVDIKIAVEITGSVVRLLASGHEKVRWDFGDAMGDGRVGLGSKNGEARFDDVVVEPLDAEQFEFLELFNTTSSPVDLAGWQVSGPVDLLFAEGTSIGPRETLVLVGFDPADGRKVDNFRARFGSANSVPLIGPYRGELARGSEPLRLLRPAGGAEAGFVLVDRVGYDDEPPWPVAANGAGSSLQRRAPNSFADFATSWMADQPTPGAAVFALLGDMDGDGKVDSIDADALSLALQSPDLYEQIYGVSAVLLGDMDRDGELVF
ncbi:MAG: CotH kinase family protein, partial [Pirellulales bacterium]